MNDDKEVGKVHQNIQAKDHQESHLEKQNGIQVRIDFGKNNVDEATKLLKAKEQREIRLNNK